MDWFINLVGLFLSMLQAASCFVGFWFLVISFVAVFLALSVFRYLFKGKY